MVKDTSEELKELEFRRSSDGKLVKAAAAGDVSAFCKAFKRDLSKERKRFGQLVGHQTMEIASLARFAWSDGADIEVAERIAQYTSNTAEIATLLEQRAVGSESIPPFIAILAAEKLFLRSEDLTPEQVAGFYVYLSRFETSTPEASILGQELSYGVPCQLVTHGLAPFVIGILQGSLKRGKTLRDDGRTSLRRILNDCTDTDGMPHSGLLDDLSCWIQPFVIATGWATAFKESWSNASANSRWQAHLRQVSTLMSMDGYVTRSGNAVSADFANNDCGLLSTAMNLADMDSDEPAVQLVREVTTRTATRRKKKNEKGGRKRTKSSQAASIACGNQSDWAALAVLRNSMQADADVYSVSWNDAHVRLGVCCNGQRLFSGNWDYHISVDGHAQPDVGSWVCTCWFQDDEVAFAELERGSSNGLRHVRHVLLGLKDHAGILTDSVTSADARAKLEFASRLPPTSVPLTTNSITRELRGSTGLPELRLIPAWLDDDRLQNCGGDLKATNDGLVVIAEGIGGLTAPLVLDWHPDRKAADADWNRLTVTEDRQLSTPQMSAGFRVRIGRLQLLLYRSLRRANSLRAVLGFHTPHETVYAYIRNSGSIDPLVQVESDA